MVESSISQLSQVEVSPLTVTFCLEITCFANATGLVGSLGIEVPIAKKIGIESPEKMQ